MSLANPAAPVEVGYTDTISTVYGVAVEGTEAYASGIHFTTLDISDPANPNPSGQIPNHKADLHIAVDGDYAYTSSAMDSTTFNVITISNPLLPVEAGFFYASVPDFVIKDNVAYLAHYDGFSRATVSDPLNPYIYTTSP